MRTSSSSSRRQPADPNIFAIPKVTLFTRMGIIFLLPVAALLVRERPYQCISQTLIEDVVLSDEEVFHTEELNCSFNVLVNYVKTLEQHINQLTQTETRDLRNVQLLRVQEFAGVQTMIMSVTFSLWLTTIISLILTYKAEQSTIMTCEFILMQFGGIFCLYFSVIQWIYGSGTLINELTVHVCHDRSGAGCDSISMRIDSLLIASVLLIVAGLAFLSQVALICLDPTFGDEYQIDEEYAMRFRGPTIEIPYQTEEEIEMQVEHYKSTKMERKERFDQTLKLKKQSRKLKKKRVPSVVKEKDINMKRNELMEESKFREY